MDEDEIVESAIVSGIAYSRDEAKITLRHVPDRPGVAAAIFGPLAAANVNVDMIVQNVGAEGTTDMTFTVGRADLPRALAILAEIKGASRRRHRAHRPRRRQDQRRRRRHAQPRRRRQHDVQHARRHKAINIQVISTSEIKVSVLIAAEYTELAVRALHTAYGLDA